jgi:hypothetical protein
MLEFLAKFIETSRQNSRRHSDPIEPLSTGDIIRQDAKHAELRREAIRARFERYNSEADA